MLTKSHNTGEPFMKNHDITATPFTDPDDLENNVSNNRHFW